MARTDDDFGLALDIALAVADRTHRASSRTNLQLEQARAQVREMEALRLASKYGTPESEAAARAAIVEQGLRLDEALQVAARARIERVHVAEDHTVLHGRIRAPKPSGLQVVAIDPNNKPIAQARADDRGYFLLDLQLFAQPKRSPIVEAAADAPASIAVTLLVRRDDREVLRDREPTVLRPGRAVYRELTIVEDPGGRT